MPYKIKKSGQTRIFALSGDLKFGDHQIIETLTETLDKDAVRRLVIDLGQVEKLDSYGIGVLLKCDQLARDRAKPLVIRGVSGAIAKTLQMFKLDETLTVEWQ